VPAKSATTAVGAARLGAPAYSVTAISSEGEMAAYIVAEHTIRDAEKFEEYRTKVGPIIVKHGGRYITSRAVR